MSNKFIITLLLLINFIGFSQVTYYVDADALDDTGNGTSEATAWKTIAKVNSETFNPGDQILFNSGDLFYGKLIVSSSGNSSAQITFGKYGGTARPIINGRNYLACIDASGQEYLTFNDLELVNNSDEDTEIIDLCTNGTCNNGADQKRYGFYANSQGGIKNNFIFNNLEIHNIYPSTAGTNAEYNGFGIQFTGWGSGNGNYFDGITIENCEIYDISELGISINKWGNPTPENRHRNVIVRNNYIHHTGGSGAVYFEVNDYLFEYNLFTYTGDYSMDVGHTPSRQRGRGSGFWCVRTSNGILQYNEFSHAHGPKDSCGAHIDIENDNVIIQYNLSWDNAGGFAEYMGANTNCIYRYNVSINDGWRVKWDGTSTIEDRPDMYTAKGQTNGQPGSSVWFSNYYGCSTCDVASTENQVYNNTIYIGKHNGVAPNGDSFVVDIDAHIEFEALSANNEVKNNIFFVAGSSKITYVKDAGVGTGNVFDNNMYNKEFPTDPFFMGVNDIAPGWPLFLNANGLTADDYRIKPGSPAINAGADISSNGVQDYWYNSLIGIPSGETDIGAHEKKCADDTTFSGGSWSDVPGSSDQVYINSDYTLPNSGSIEACQLEVSNNSTLTIPAGEYIKVNGNITVTPGSKIIIEHEGSLVQVDDNALVTNNGTIEVKKTTPVLPHNMFSILGSPMSQEKRDMVFTNSTVVMNHTTSNFVPHSQVELDDLDADNFADDNGDNWSFYSGSENIDPGVGFLVGPPSGGGSIDVTHNQGTLNNGVIPFTAVYNGTQNGSPNILSNPYASAIDAYEFIDQNAIVDAIYYWEHITIPTSIYPGYRTENWDMGDISMYNLSGGVKAPNESGASAKPINQYVASGQGFGIKANAAGTVNFNNSMRLTGNNDTYRNNENIDRLYLKVENPTYSLQSGALIAFTAEATDGIDSQYDAKRLATPVSLYSIVENNELSLQGRSEFNENHIIPIGFRTQVEESQIYNISLGSIEGDNLSQATIYLKDNLLNITTNLSEENYTFTSNESNQKDRFEIVFTEEFLGNQDINALPIGIYPNPTNGILNITSPQSVMTEVTIYNIAGREVRSIAIEDQNDYKIDISRLETSMYFVKIQTQNGSITKQIIKQ
jgi:hypothetical protein